MSSFGVYGVSDLPAGARVVETTPLESKPETRDVYSYSKWRQETLFHEYQAEYGFPLVVLRPGVIYGEGGGAMSSRVGLNIFGLFFRFGRHNLLPLTYVTNCAEAIVVAGTHPDAPGNVYNVHDDDLPTAAAYLSEYSRRVKRVTWIPVPYVFTRALSGLVEWYHGWSHGQLPAVLTPYKSDAMWKGNRFDNAKLKSIGWKQLVSTRDGLDRCFAYWRELERSEKA